MCSACKAFIQKQWLCNSSSAEVSDIQGYEKRLWSNDCCESRENDSEILKDKFFNVRYNRGRKRVDLTSVKEVAIVV